MPDIGIVIVTYNSADRHRRVSGCRRRSTAREIVVVDNASRDGTIAEVARRGVRLIANPRQSRFRRRPSIRVLPHLDSAYILLLNPDSVLVDGPGIAAGGVCTCRRCGGAGGRLVDAEGVRRADSWSARLPTPAALIFEALLLNRIWPGNPVNWQYRCLDWDWITIAARGGTAGRRVSDDPPDGLGGTRAASTRASTRSGLKMWIFAAARSDRRLSVVLRAGGCGETYRWRIPSASFASGDAADLLVW